MVEEWKKAAEVSRELEYKALERVLLNVGPHVATSKGCVLICSSFTEVQRRCVLVLPIEFVLVQCDLSLQFSLGLQYYSCSEGKDSERSEEWLRSRQND